MIIRRPGSSDWEIFSAMAEAEGWKVPDSEWRLFQGSWSQNAYVLDDKGFCGLITAVVYEKSAWIGNLIVPRKLRGQGYGSALFKHALKELDSHGILSIWLTASDQGRGIYEKEGFVAVDSILRWVMLSPSTHIEPDDAYDCPYEQLLDADRSAWNESRTLLTDHLCNIGRPFAAEGSIALLQRGHDIQVVGPWYSKHPPRESHQKLMNSIIAAAEPTIALVIDSFASSVLPEICESAGFQLTGRTSLMIYGDVKPVDMQRMMSLASLGSFG